MKALLLLSLVPAAVVLSGCNTVKGVGQDITGAASWTQDKMTGNSAAKSSDADYVQNPPQFPKSSN